jgi:hypothetical protein
MKVGIQIYSKRGFYGPSIEKDMQEEQLMQQDQDLYMVVRLTTGEFAMLAPIKTIGKVYRLHVAAEHRIQANPNGVVLYGNGRHEDIHVKYACRLRQAIGEHECNSSHN